MSNYLIAMDRVVCAARLTRFVKYAGSNCSVYEGLLVNAEMDAALKALDNLQEGSAAFDCKAALRELITQDEKKDGVR